MKLKLLLKKYLSIDSDIEISNLDCDSRLIKKGGLFLAYPSVGSDDKKFIDNAVRDGAGRKIRY